MIECSKCDGMGEIIDDVSHTHTCPRCAGTGELSKELDDNLHKEALTLCQNVMKFSPNYNRTVALLHEVLELAISKNYSINKRK